MQIQQIQQQIQKKLPLVIAIICGIVAILLLNVYIRKRELEIFNRIKQQAQQELQKIQQTQAQTPQQKMGVALVAAKAIPAKIPITPDLITFKQIPAEYIQPGVAVSLEEIIGQELSGPVAVGEQIIKAKLRSPSTVKIAKGLSGVTPSGRRAVAVKVEDISSISNLIQPGDYVDVLALITLPERGESVPQKGAAPSLLTLFQGVEILSIGELLSNTSKSFDSSDKKDKTKTPAVVAKDRITLALTPEEASLLSFVQEHGKIKISLRSAEDSRVEAVEPANWDTLLEYLDTETEGKPGIKKKGKKPVVEIYRGLQKQVVTLSEKRK